MIIKICGINWLLFGMINKSRGIGWMSMYFFYKSGVEMFSKIYLNNC